MLVDETKHADEIYKLHEWSGAPIAYQNMLIVMVAEGMRRRGDRNAGAELMSKCSNPVYKRLWFRWLSRVPT